MIIYYNYVSIIKINNFKFSVRYHSVTELEATLLIKYIPDIEKFLPVSIFKMTFTIQHCSILKVAFDLFTDILSAVGLLSTGNRKHIIFFCCFRTMLDFCSIVVAILKMETGRNFSMSGINSGHHSLPTYEMALKSNNVEFVRYCGSHFENPFSK
jgi:hypothetical protein